MTEPHPLQARALIIILVKSLGTDSFVMHREQGLSMGFARFFLGEYSQAAAIF